MISEALGGAIIGGVSAFLVMRAVDYCIIRLNSSPQPAAPRGACFSGSRTYRILSLLFCAFVCAVVYSVFFRIDFGEVKGELILKYLVLLIGVALAYYIVKDAFVTRIFVTEDGIRKKGVFGAQQILWADVDLVTYSPANRCFLIKSANKRPISISALMLGVPVMVRHIRNRVSEDALTQARPMLDYFDPE